MTQPWNDHIERLLDMTPDGANNARLNAALKQLLLAWKARPQSDADLDTAVTEIAGALNWDINEARRAFASFREKATDESKNDFTESFLASKEHLLFGKLVGDELQIIAMCCHKTKPVQLQVLHLGKNFCFYLDGIIIAVRQRQSLCILTKGCSS